MGNPGMRFVENFASLWEIFTTLPGVYFTICLSDAMA